MQRRLEERRLGTLVLPEAGAALGPRPAAFARACCGDAALVARLARTAELPGHSGAVSAASWAEAGELLVTGAEDCRLKVWNLQRLHTAKHGVECTVESVRHGRRACEGQASSCNTLHTVRRAGMHCLAGLAARGWGPLCTLMPVLSRTE